eukprot:3920952-Pyramimonas_sp.AAC.1
MPLKVIDLSLGGACAAGRGLTRAGIGSGAAYDRISSTLAAAQICCARARAPQLASQISGPTSLQCPVNSFGPVGIDAFARYARRSYLGIEFSADATSSKQY